MSYRYFVNIFYEDTDAQGSVYHSRYAQYFERARTSWLKSMGFKHTQIARDLNVQFVLKSLALDYKRSAKLDDVLAILVCLKEMKGASLSFYQEAYLWDEEKQALGPLLVTADVTLALVDLQGRVARIPAVLRELLESKKEEE